MNAPLHPQPEPAASLPGLTRDAEARAIVQDAAARVLALAMDAAQTAAKAPAAGGCA